MNNLWEIYSLRSNIEVKNEVQRVALKIGEISFTLKLASIFNLEVKKVMEDLHKRKKDLIDYYLADSEEKKKQQELKELKEKKRFRISGGKHKKKMEKNSITDNLGKVLKNLDKRLQYLSILMFSVGNHTHINVNNILIFFKAEEWILETIQNTIENAYIIELPEGVPNEVFPILCCYLSIDKYILFVEQLRSIQKTKIEWVNYKQIAWLDALVEFRANCLEDSYNHLIQFYEDNRKELEIIEKVAVVEKIIAFSFVISRILTGGDKCEDLITSNLIKHLPAKKAEKTYKIDIFSEGKRSEEDIKQIITSRNAVLEDFKEDIELVFNTKKKNFAYEAFQVMILNIVLNFNEAGEPSESTKLLLKKGNLHSNGYII